MCYFRDVLNNNIIKPTKTITIDIHKIENLQSEKDGTVHHAMDGCILM